MSTFFRLVSLAAVTSLGASLAACGGGSEGTGGSGGETTTTTTTTTSSSTTTTSGTGGTAPAEPTFVAHFDPMMGELAEGLFVTGDKAYVGYAALGKIVTVDLPAGTVKDYASIPTPGMNEGFMLGIVVAANGDLYVGFGGGPGTTVVNGVYKIPAGGGMVTDPWAMDPEMNFPNGLTYDDKMNIVVADSGGFIFKIAPDGTVTKWLSDPSLSAAGANCMFGAPFPIGANGIVFSKGVFYVSNTNIGQIVSIPQQPDGTAGTPTILAGPDCNALGGIDGIASDGAGGILGVINGQNKLIQVAAGKSTVDVLFTGKPLDNPASIHVATVGGKTSAYITNAAFFNMTDPAPGLLAYPLP